jgi:uncharacterized coiled-coil protein SlyX
MSKCNQEPASLFSRKGLWVCVVAAIIACAWVATDAYAGNKKSNPSPQGEANGVAHRVATLESKLAAALEVIAALDSDLAAVEEQVATLEDQVADLEARVADLEAAAVSTP